MTKIFEICVSLQNIKIYDEVFESMSFLKLTLVKLTMTKVQLRKILLDK